MRITSLETESRGGQYRFSARVTWEELNEPAAVLEFVIAHEPGCPVEPSPEAFLLACFPLAVEHGERRIAINAPVCSKLIEGLQTVHCWWHEWGLTNVSMPRIEPQGRPDRVAGRNRAAGFFSGGVDSLHMLIRNRKLFEPGDPAYIRDALVVHGFDIGKRKHRLEDDHFKMTMSRLAPVAAALDLGLRSCSTNLRHLPTRPGVWSYLHHGAALAAVAHAAICGPAQVYLAATFNVAHMTPWGSHPLIDPQYSSQRVTLFHEGSQFSRLAKVREVANSRFGLGSLRVCPANARGRLNCGECEKCIRTRLELLAAGIDETTSFGKSAMPAEFLMAKLNIESDHQVSYYGEVLAGLKVRGFYKLAAIVAGKLTDLERKPGERSLRPGRNARAA